MLSINLPSIDHYLDAYELAELLGITPAAVVLRASQRPWLLPPRAHLADPKLLRWRQHEVDYWRYECNA
jgi:predicted DNA-binding transcriptional regulator AlpA